MTLQEGKRYRDRGGREHGPLERNGSNDTFLWRAGEEAWLPNGRRIGNIDSELDLVEEVIPTHPKTLRDEFAMAALTGIVARTPAHISNKTMIEGAFEIADEAMALRARAKTVAEG